MVQWFFSLFRLESRMPAKPMDYSIPIAPKRLMESEDGVLAYSVAAFAASQNDAPTLRAFLAAGLEPGARSNALSPWARGKWTLNPWLKAVENDAVDCVRAIMETPGVNLSDLMNLRVEGNTAMSLAVLNGARRTLSLWKSMKIEGVKPNRVIKSPIDLGSNRALGMAAQFGDEETVRWLLSLGAAPSLDKGIEGVAFEHFLAWGDCAGVLEERLNTVAACAEVCQHAYTRTGVRSIESKSKSRPNGRPGKLGSTTLHDISAQQLMDETFWKRKPILYLHSFYLRRALGVIPAHCPDVLRSYPASVNALTPIGCALLNESPNALTLFVRHFGREIVDAQAQVILRVLQAVSQCENFGEDTQEELDANQYEAQMERAISVCERWVLGSTAHPRQTTKRRGVAAALNPRSAMRL